ESLMAFSWNKVVMIGGAAVLGGAVCLVTGGAAAPLVGGWIGSTFMGLSGAAATSAGLAALGGGSLAAGGLGMAGGTMVVAGGAAAAGAGTLSAATSLLTNNLVEGKRCSGCHSLLETKDKFCCNCGKDV